MFDLYQDTIQEMDDLAEVISTKTYRLADLEMQRVRLQHDLYYHAQLLTNIRALETNLKVFVVKVGAYFHFM